MTNSYFSAMRVAALITFLVIGVGLSITGFDRPSSEFSLRHRSAPRITGALPDFVTIARRFDPSLVHISTVNGAVSAGADNAPPGLGSGVILRSDGYMVTNDHVVKNAEKIFVRLADRRQLPARLVSRDERSDLALIKVAAPAALTAASLGDSDLVQTGEWVVALGSPFGLDRTLTAGIVSAKTRRLPTGLYSQYIQTDVTMNPGSSGGPLLNLEGRVIGINTAILSRDGNNIGINFAIPVNSVKEVLPALFSGRRVIRGWVGLSTQTASSAVPHPAGADRASGAVVVGVAPHGPAAQAGIRPGDVVVAYDGKSIQDAAELSDLVARTAVGRRVGLYVSRQRMLYRAVLAVSELEESASSSHSRSAWFRSSGTEFRS